MDQTIKKSRGPEIFAVVLIVSLLFIFIILYRVERVAHSRSIQSFNEIMNGQAQALSASYRECREQDKCLFLDGVSVQKIDNSQVQVTDIRVRCESCQ